MVVVFLRNYYSIPNLMVCLQGNISDSIKTIIRLCCFSSTFSSTQLFALIQWSRLIGQKHLFIDNIETELIVKNVMYMSCLK